MKIGWAAGQFVVGWAARPAIYAVDVQARIVAPRSGNGDDADDAETAGSGFALRQAIAGLS
jgi:hypothetical protein